MDRTKVAAELLEIAKDLTAGVRTAKVEYRTTTKGASVTAMQAQPSMSVGDVKSNASKFHRDVEKALKQIAKAFEGIPAFTGPVSYDVSAVNDVRLSSSRGGLLFVLYSSLQYTYDGERDSLSTLFYKEVEAAFKAVGIRV